MNKLAFTGILNYVLIFHKQGKRQTISCEEIFATWMKMLISLIYKELSQINKINIFQ